MATLRKIGEKWICDYYDARGKRHRERPEEDTKEAALALTIYGCADEETLMRFIYAKGDFD